MTDRLVLQIEVESDDGRERKDRFVYELPEGDTADHAFEWFSYYLSTEAQIESRWNEFLNKLPDPSGLRYNKSIDTKKRLDAIISPYYDAINIAWAWMEIGNLLSSARIHLARARTYKEFEPKQCVKSGKENETLYNIHLQKMDEFHLAVKNIKKLEDMILRLIFEGLGASLEGIDTSKDEWERQLTLDKIKKGLKPLPRIRCGHWLKLTLRKIKESLKQQEKHKKLRNMSDNEYKELRKIIGEMGHSSKQHLSKFWQYRHALEHRMPQSVDYIELYSVFESRPEPSTKNEEVVGIPGFIGSRSGNLDWRFEDLYKTTIAVYKHYLKLLERLDKLPTFKHLA